MKRIPTRGGSKSLLESICLGSVFTICQLLSIPIAVLHRLAVWVRLTHVSRYLSNSPDGLYNTLRDIWLTRLMRELFKLSMKMWLRGAALTLVNGTLPENRKTGYVIAICHTPWFRLLAEWCRDRDFALVLVDGAWINRTGHVNVPGGVSGLRRLVRHLRSGGRAVVIADVFDRSRCCGVRFFEEKRLASLLPARLAALGRVPLHAVIPSLQAKQLHIRTGPLFIVGTSAVEQQTVTQGLLAFFEQEIRKRPALLARFSNLR